jgi:hypothetical protein
MHKERKPHAVRYQQKTYSVAHLGSFSCRAIITALPILSEGYNGRFAWLRGQKLKVIALRFLELIVIG